MRRILDGREYYTEGKQTISLTPGEVTSTQTLVRAQDVQTPLYEIIEVTSGSDVILGADFNSPGHVMVDGAGSTFRVPSGSIVFNQISMIGVSGGSDGS